MLHCASLVRSQPGNTHARARARAGASGDAVMGAAVAGLALLPGLLGGEAATPEWAPLYDPSRLAGLLGSLGSLGDLATEIGWVPAGLRGAGLGRPLAWTGL